MKALFLSILFSLTCIAYGQVSYKSIHLKRANLSSKVAAVTNEVADHALRISDYLYNSKEFQDSLAKRDFSYNNVCSGCGPNTEQNKPRISGAQILDKLFAKPEISLTLFLKKVGKPPIGGKCFGLGYTCPGTDTITSNYKNINCDMSKDLPFEYAYAVHLCHENMHNVGYCHTDHVDDVAESVGWIAFHFIDKWYKQGIRVP